MKDYVSIDPGLSTTVEPGRGQTAGTPAKGAVLIRVIPPGK
jgi:hypothetical protein